MTEPVFSRVLVPLDGSSNAERIVPHLRRLLPRNETTVVLLEALAPGHPGSPEDAEFHLRLVASKLTRDGYPSTFILRVGPPAETILEEARDRDSTLIALATHGRTGLERLLLGSVAEKILQASPVPVLLTRSSPPSPAPVEREQLPLKGILLPLDGSAEGLEALGPALDVARHADARIHLLEVGEASPYQGHWESPDGVAKQADQLLRDACVPTSFERRRGDAAEEILKCAGEQGMDLIVMSTHGRSGLPLWLKGSVCAEVLRNASVPILTIRRHSAHASKPVWPAEISTPIIPPA